MVARAAVVHLTVINNIGCASTFNDMTPLRDPFNSTGPEWSQPITPLRIAKRDTSQRQHESQLSRRSSNTFAKLTRSNLVSRSPFRSQPSPTPSPASSRPSNVSHAPSPRRVSGEKRPRPDSLQSHVENERPLGFKRRQSKGFQGLIEKEPVTKSPFLHPATPDEDPFPPPPPPTKVLLTSHLPTPTSSTPPGRPSLVSKRLHGPRLIGHDVPKRHRRKTVTFDETCDVVTFERDDSDHEEIFSDYSEGDYVETVDYDEPVGIVEDGSPHPHCTPPLDVPEILTSVVRQSPSLSTPPQNPSVGSIMPLGRSTHSERARSDRMSDDVEEDVKMLPPSPSPAKIDVVDSAGTSWRIGPIALQLNDDLASGLTDSFDFPEQEIVELSFMSSEGASGLPPEPTAALQRPLEAVKFEWELGLGTPNSQIRTSTPPLNFKSPGARDLPRPPMGRSESPLPADPPHPCASETTRVDIDDVRSALERLVQDVVTDSANASLTVDTSSQDLKAKGSNVSLTAATVTKRKSNEPSDLNTTLEEDEPLDDRGDLQNPTPNGSETSSSSQRTPELLSGGGFMSPTLSRNTSDSSNPIQPVSKEKDAIRLREQMILEKRREMRRREQDEDMGYVTPPRNSPAVGRPSARRSMSTGDAEDLQAAARLATLNPPGSSVLPDLVATEEKDPLAESIARELRKLRGTTKSVSLALIRFLTNAKVIPQRYHVRQHSETIYASSDTDKVSHVGRAGDVDSGRAWRTVRRPSDMVRKCLLDCV